MTDPFATLIPDAQRFFRALQVDNTKAWFDAHKAQYTDTIRKPA